MMITQASMGTSRHILIAEDDPLVGLSMQAILEELGYRVTLAQNGQVALDADTQDAADLLLTDLRMPVMTGQELIGRIRQRRPALPVIVVTGYSDSFPDNEPGRLVLLSKPFQMRALAQAISSLLPH